jgi:molybdopterin/thiamine biosynthesis adenylyltransferase
MRLPEVGREMQAKLRASSVRVTGSDSSARVEALYLAGAGVGKLSAHESIASAARALNPEVSIDAHDDANEDRALDAQLTSMDPAAARIATGALAALRSMKRIFAAT